MAEALASVGRTIDGVANRTQEKAVAFAQKHHVKRVYDSIDDLLASDEIDAVYLTTPHNTHIIYLRKALQAGKHVTSPFGWRASTGTFHQGVDLSCSYEPCYAIGDGTVSFTGWLASTSGLSVGDKVSIAYTSSGKSSENNKQQGPPRL